MPDSELASTGCFQRQSQVHVDLRQRGITTLGDFVDEESIGEVASRAEISFEQLKVGIFAERALRSSNLEPSRSSKLSSSKLTLRSASLPKRRATRNQSTRYSPTNTLRCVAWWERCTGCSSLRSVTINRSQLSLITIRYSKRPKRCQ